MCRQAQYMGSNIKMALCLDLCRQAQYIGSKIGMPLIRDLCRQAQYMGSNIKMALIRNLCRQAQYMNRYKTNVLFFLHILNHRQKVTLKIKEGSILPR